MIPLKSGAGRLLRIFPGANWGLQQRAMIYVALLLLAVFGSLFFVAMRTINQAVGEVHRYRIDLARMVAHHLDGTFNTAIGELRLAAAEIERMGQEEAGVPATKNVLRDLRWTLANQGLKIVTYASLVDELGMVVLTDLEREIVESRYHIAAVQEALRGEGNFSSIEIVATEEGEPQQAASLAVPVRDGEGNIRGALSVDVVPDESALWLPPPLNQEEQGFFIIEEQGFFIIEVINERGMVLASIPPGIPVIYSPHKELVKEMLQQRVPDTRVHEPGDGGKGHIIAFAPLSTLPWGIVIEQDKDAAFALPDVWRRQTLLLGSVSFFVALGISWIIARRIVRPVRALTRASQRIAAGDLSTPLSFSSSDEVGTLTRNFELMRQQLKASLERIENWNRELEQHLEERTKELREKEALQRKLLEKTITAQEEERKRIARELHDEVGQALTALTLGLGSIEKSLPENLQEARQNLTALREMASRELDEVRRLVTNLRPDILDDMGLVAAIQWYLDTSLSKAGVKSWVESEGVHNRLPAPVETALFRIIQEAITNIVKHAQASITRVKLEGSASRVKVLIEDNGKGFDLQEVQQGRHFGLLGMAERAELLGGTFNIWSQPGEGTRIEITIPINEGEGER